MIIVWGSLADPPVQQVAAGLAAIDVDVVHIDDAAIGELRYDVLLGEHHSGWLQVDGRVVPVEEIRGMYARPTTSGDSRAAAATMMMSALASGLPGCVVNRPVAGRSNWSKPFQLTLLERAGLLVPDTLVTTDPAAARAFLERHRRVVYKSVSGVRSIVSTIDHRRPGRLDDFGVGPVQFQQWIAGTDVRVHVVGDRWFATKVTSDADDYRYATAVGSELEMVAVDIPVSLARRLVELTRSMGLAVSGTDLRVTPENEWFAFEVNPSPGFTFYEAATGQPIAAAIAQLLSTGVDPTRAPSLNM
ncbi:MAG: hypothetical protein WCC60_06825 [Ilumatobacteraceae bacterium]